MEAGSGVCAPPSPPPLPPPACEMARPELGAPEVCSLPGKRKEAHVPPPHGRGMCRMRLGPVVGLCSAFPATVLQGGVGAAWAGAEKRTLLTPGREAEARARWERSDPLSGSQVSLSRLSTKPRLCWVACRLASRQASIAWRWPDLQGSSSERRMAAESEEMTFGFPPNLPSVGSMLGRDMALWSALPSLTQQMPDPTDQPTGCLDHNHLWLSFPVQGAIPATRGDHYPRHLRPWHRGP